MTLYLQNQISIQFLSIIFEYFRYFHWNGTSIAYPNKTLSSAQSLVSWTRGQIGSNYVTWIGSSGRKSLNLSKKLENGSQNSLLVFTNRQHRKMYNQAIQAVQEIGNFG